jgi:predicted MPP superfamily phosphohydrolase
VSRGSANTLPIRLGVPTEVGLFELVDPELA